MSDDEKIKYNGFLSEEEKQNHERAMDDKLLLMEYAAIYKRICEETGQEEPDYYLVVDMFNRFIEHTDAKPCKAWYDE